MSVDNSQPIGAFARVLRAFSAGRLSNDELMSEVYRQLAVERTPTSALLEVLTAHQAGNPIAPDVHELVLAQIGGWPQDPTVITGATEASRSKHGKAARVGDVLQGRFNLVELIGVGGMSRVFKAVDLRRVEARASDPYIAVKVLTEPFSDYFGSITALQREAHKLQSLAHANIVRVIDCDRDGQIVFMTMEYLSGESLQKIFRSAGADGMQREAAESVIASSAGALEYAHHNHIVHGDLKPGNIFVTAQGAVKVIDFGMAKFLARPGAATGPESHSESMPKAVSARYASPEMLAGADPKPSDDIYALACIAYEALTGNHPFAPAGGSVTQASRQPLMRHSRLSPQQHDALSHALAFNEKDRTQSIRQFITELNARDHTRRRRYWAMLAACFLGVVLAAYFLSRVHRTEAVPDAAALAVAPGSAIRDCPTCPLMTILPTGRFIQGADSGDPDELTYIGPRHSVSIGYPLAMGSNETSVAEFRAFVDATHRDMGGCTVYDGQWQFRPSANWESPGFAQSPLHPVTCVAWNDAVAYAEWLSVRSGHRYRLPSASEWEYAARAGADAIQPWGSNGTEACRYANLADQSAAQRYPGWKVFPCSDGFVGTAPVGTFKTNAWGLNDLLGNAFEWVQDCWHADYQGAPNDGSARMDGDCKDHELRGGSWFSSPRFVNVAYRNRFAAQYRSSSVGFRLVREMGK